VTQWNVECDYEALLKDSKDIRFLTYGAETCPESGRPHHQMFVYLRGNSTYGNRTLNRLGNLFGPVHCSIVRFVM
jgi:hypothetical protein